MSDLAAAVIHAGSVGALMLTSLAIMGSPGPATISLAAAGSAHGIRPSLRYMLGIVLGTALVLIGVATGITATLLAVPGLRPVLIGASAVYLIWLAYRIATAPPLADQGTVAAGAPSFAGGALLGAANPKAWVAIAAVYASSRLESRALADASEKVLVLAAMIVVIMSLWLAVGASLAPLLRNPRSSRALNLILALALVGATALAVVK